MLETKNIETYRTNEDSYDGLITLIEASQGKSSWLIASCEQGSLQTQIIQQYETELSPSIPCYRITVDRQEPSLRGKLEQLVKDNPTLQQPKALAVISVTNIREILTIKLDQKEDKSPIEKFFGYLQWTREGLRRFPYPIVLWVTPQILRRLSREAPDFWSWRGGVFRFNAMAMDEVKGLRNEIINLADMSKNTSSFLLPLSELEEQIKQIKQQDEQSSTLAILYDRVGQVYASRIVLGESESLTDDVEKGLEFYQKSIELSIKLDLKVSLCQTLIRLGHLYYILEQYKKCKLVYKEGLEIARKINNQQEELIALNQLGNICKLLGEYQTAIDYYQTYLTIAQENEYKREEGDAFNNLGNVYNSLGD
ncbi:MAG: tetratricopeptide repeat protein, partial [Microcystaceae cyanobacterium]